MNMENRISRMSWTLAAFCAAFIAVGTTPSEAQRRPDARVLSCDQARSLVRQNGAVVMTTGRYTYDRYVADDRFCHFGEITEPAWIGTADTPSCRVGYRCINDPGPEDDFPRLFRRN